MKLQENSNLKNLGLRYYEDKTEILVLVLQPRQVA